MALIHLKRDYYNLLNLKKTVFHNPSHNPVGIKYLTRLRLRFSYLHFQKFKPSFLDAMDQLCSCSTVIENTIHYFFPSPTSSLQNQISIIVRSIIDQNEKFKIIQISVMVIQLVLSTVTN